MLGGCAAGDGTNVLACTAGKDADVVPLHDDNSYVRQLRGDDDSEDDMPLDDGKDVDDDSDVHLNGDKTPPCEPSVAHDTVLVVDADQDSCSPLALQSEAAKEEGLAEEEGRVDSVGSTISYESTPCRVSAKSGKTLSSQEDKPSEYVAKQPCESSEIEELAVGMTNDDAKAAYDKICSFGNIGGVSPTDDKHKKDARDADPAPAAEHCIGPSEEKRGPTNSHGNVEKDCFGDVRWVEDADNIELMYGSSEVVLVLASDADDDDYDDQAVEPDAQVVSIGAKLTRVGSKQSTQTDGTAKITLDTNDETKTRTSNSLQETVVQVSRRGTGFLESLFSCGVPCIDKKEHTLTVNEIRDTADESKNIANIAETSAVVSSGTAEDIKADKTNEATVRGNDDLGVERRNDEVNPDVEEKTAEETNVVAKSHDESTTPVKDDKMKTDEKVASKVKKDKRKKSRMNGMRMRVFKQLSKKKRERKPEKEASNELEIQHGRVMA